MKLSWQHFGLLLCGSLIVGCSDAATSTVADNGGSAAPAAAAPTPAPTSAEKPAPVVPGDPLLEGIDLEDPAEFGQIKSAYESAPTDADAIQSYVGTLLNFAWAHANRGDSEKSDASIIRAGGILQKAARDKVELPVLPESSLQAQVFYGYSCVLAKQGKAAESLTVLDQAISVGFENMPMIKEDKDLAAVRELPAFEEKVAAWEARFEALKKQRAEALVRQAKEDLAAGEGFEFDFDVTDINGRQINLAALKGRVCVVDIWGTWCPPCRQEVPGFVKLQDQYGKYGLQIVGLNDERGPSEEANIATVKNFSDNNSMNYPCALVSEEIMEQLPEFKGYPTTLFIDHHGKVRMTAFGYHEYGYIETVVKSLLTELHKERGTATN